MSIPLYLHDVPILNSAFNCFRCLQILWQSCKSFMCTAASLLVTFLSDLYSWSCDATCFHLLLCSAYGCLQADRSASNEQYSWLFEL